MDSFSLMNLLAPAKLQGAGNLSEASPRKGYASTTVLPTVV